MARITRSVALATRQQDYVSAAIARGEGGGWIVFREMGPNVIAPVVVESTIRVAFAVMLVASLSFLGLGAQPPAPEWGLMIAEGTGIPASGAVDDRRPRRGHRLHRDRLQLGR